MANAIDLTDADKVREAFEDGVTILVKVASRKGDYFEYEPDGDTVVLSGHLEVTETLTIEDAVDSVVKNANTWAGVDEDGDYVEGDSYTAKCPYCGEPAEVVVVADGEDGGEWIDYQGCEHHVGFIDAVGNDTVRGGFEEGDVKERMVCPDVDDGGETEPEYAVFRGKPGEKPEFRSKLSEIYGGV